MDELKKRFPRDMEYLISLDTTLPVAEGINEIVHTLFEAVLLVILVVFVFLQNWRATLIPLVTVPVSLIGAFIFFPLLGFSINVLSLLGLVLAIGIVVDDAIVVVEAVMHHIEQGMPPKEATIKAMEEVSGPVIAIGLVLSAVFVPVGFMGGITGRFYKQFAITIALSVLLSVVNALTLSPALAALLLKAPTGKKTLLTPFYNWFNKVFGRGTDAYVSFAGILIRKTARSLIFIAILVRRDRRAGRRIPAGFIPEEDQGYLLAQVNLPDASSLERTDLVMKKAEAIIKANEGVEGYNTVTGYSLVTGSYSSNRASSSSSSRSGATARPRRTTRTASSPRSTRPSRSRSPRPPRWRSGRRRSPASARGRASRCSSRTAAAARPSSWPSRPRSSWRRRASGPRSGASRPSTARACPRSTRTSTAARC